VRGVTLEELRAFLTSVLVTPASRSRNWTGWMRFWTRESEPPRAVAPAGAEPPPASAAPVAAATPTSLVK